MRRTEELGKPRQTLIRYLSCEDLPDYISSVSFSKTSEESRLDRFNVCQHALQLAALFCVESSGYEVVDCRPNPTLVIPVLRTP